MKMNRLLVLVSLGLVLGSLPLVATAKKVSKVKADAVCSYSFKSEGSSLEWVAFKTTEKTPVKGTFTNIVVKDVEDAPQPHLNINDLLMNLQVTIDTITVDSANPKRDENLKKSFFGKFVDPIITAHVTKTNGDDQKGTMDVLLKINGIEQSTTFDYEVNAGVLTGKASIDFPLFRLNKALKSLHKVCIDLHKGPDGISKTWPVAEVSFKANLVKSCK